MKYEGENKTNKPIYAIIRLRPGETLVIRDIQTDAIIREVSSDEVSKLKIRFIDV